MYRRYERYFEFVKEAAQTAEAATKTVEILKGAKGFLSEILTGGKDFSKGIKDLEALAAKGDEGAKMAIAKIKASKGANELEHHISVMDKGIERLPQGGTRNFKNEDGTVTKKVEGFVTQNQYDAQRVVRTDIAKNEKTRLKSEKDAIDAEHNSTLSTFRNPKPSDKNVKELITESNAKEEASRLYNPAFRNIRTTVGNDANAAKIVADDKLNKPIAAYNGPSKGTDAAKATDDAAKETTFKEEAKAFGEEAKTYAKDKWGRIKKYYKENPKKTIAMGVGGVGAVGAGGYMMRGNSND